MQRLAAVGCAPITACQISFVFAQQTHNTDHSLYPNTQALDAWVSAWGEVVLSSAGVHVEARNEGARILPVFVFDAAAKGEATHAFVCVLQLLRGAEIQLRCWQHLPVFVFDAAAKGEASCWVCSS